MRCRILFTTSLRSIFIPDNLATSRAAVAGPSVFAIDFNALSINTSPFAAIPFYAAGDQSCTPPQYEATKAQHVRTGIIEINLCAGDVGGNDT
jgi:hypothetical protein